MYILLNKFRNFRPKCRLISLLVMSHLWSILICVYEGSSSVAVATCQERSHDTNDSNYVTDVYYTETCSEMETDSL